MTIERHELFPNFIWKRIAYDDKRRRFLTYECEWCRTAITHDDAHLAQCLEEHDSFCDPKRVHAST